ncbi:MAG: PD-(D/E)XK nuclease family protein [Candidatus Hodarchaeales archaeon]
MVKKDKNVSWSEIQTWSTCRQKWFWAYDVGIVPKKIERAPSVGSCGHVAIAAVLRGEDWMQAVDGWLKRELNRRPLFDEEKEEIQAIADLIRNIIPRYLDHYHDDFKPVLVEHGFEIPIRGIKIRLIGYWDAVVQGKDGHLWLLEHKFPQTKFRTEEQLDLDGQIGTYQYAAHRLGFSIVGTIYNQILSRLPAVPKINKDGSVSKATIYTDWQTYRNFIIEQGLDPSDYQEMEGKLADFKFFQRNYIYRPKAEIRAFARDMERRIWDMRKSKKHIYRNESFITCGRCPYRELCLESLKGGDINYIIENQFEPKISREEVKSNGKKTNKFNPKA